MKNDIDKELQNLKFPSEMKLDSKQRKQILFSAAEFAEKKRHQACFQPLVVKMAALAAVLLVVICSTFLMLQNGEKEQVAAKQIATSANDLSWDFNTEKKIVVSVQENLESYRTKSNKDRSRLYRRIRNINKKISRMKARTENGYKWL